MKPGDMVIYTGYHKGTKVSGYCRVPQPVLILETLELEPGKPVSFRGLDSGGGMIHWECYGWEVLQ